MALILQGQGQLEGFQMLRGEARSFPASTDLRNANLGNFEDPKKMKMI